MNAQSPSVAVSSRVVPIDWLRGLVMVLMTVDHASEAFNAGRLMTDSSFIYHAGMSLPVGQFFTRWITHLCAPTFVFLAGTASALSVAKRVASGQRPGTIDRHLVLRGLFIAGLDLLWMPLAFFGGYRLILLQVLYAIGISFVAMALLRRLPAWALAAGGVLLIGGVDAVLGSAIDAGTTNGPALPLWAGFLVVGGLYGRVIVGYPVASWLGIMMLGFAFGQRLVARPSQRVVPGLLGIGAGALAGFMVLRGLDGFGNMGLHRENNTLVQWLHVCKYPPSVTFVALELGLMALLLAGFFAIAIRNIAPQITRPLRVLGANALFFYVIHIHLLTAVAHGLGLAKKLGLGATWLAAAATVTVLYPACAWYGRYKTGHRNFVTRWI